MVWQSKVDKSLIHPGLVRVMDGAHARLRGIGMPFKSYSGLRTFAEQDILYDQGRTQGGHVVTNARGGQSMHNYGLAVDSAPLADPKKPRGNVQWPNKRSHFYEWEPLERALMDAAEQEGGPLEYEWGGRWRFRDCPHAQVRTTVRELAAGMYPDCDDIEWLVSAHTGFLFDTPWMVNRVQFLLNVFGETAGAVDGRIGARTATAIDDFSRGHNLPDGDGITRPLVEKLLRVTHEKVTEEA